MTNTFGHWQPEYSRRGIATFPVKISSDEKKPAVAHYRKMGLPASAQLARKYADAEAFGFCGGKHSGITVIDYDSTDEALLHEGNRIFGESPLMVQTNKGLHAYYRHNGERWGIRPFPDLPIDILGEGGGFTVAAPSMGVHRPYEFIRGGLGTLADLPVAHISHARLASERPPAPTDGHQHQVGDKPQDDPGKIPVGQRNRALFEYCRSTVSYCDTCDQLLDAAQSWADDWFVTPLPEAEIVRVVNSVWNYRGGRKQIMQHIVEAHVYEALIADPGALALFAYLSAENGPNARFWIADGLSEARGWPRSFVPKGRKVLLELGVVECIRPRGNRRPALYRWRIAGD